MYLDMSELPQSRYLIDQIFNCNTDIDYYALCPTCKSFVRRFDRELDRDAFCQGCNLRFSFKDPTYTEFFCFIDPEWEIANDLEENWRHFEAVVRARSRGDSDVDEFHNELVSKQLRHSLHQNEKDRFVTVMFNTDASPIFESSAFFVTPIQIMVMELPFRTRNSNGFHFGKTNCKADKSCERCIISTM